MKRLAALLAAAILLLSACGGSGDTSQGDQSETGGSGSAAVMTMTPTRFAQETEDILKLLELDGGFFDFCVDNTVSGFSMNVWVMSGGQWVSSGEINGKIDNRRGQVGVQLLRDGCNFFQLSGGGNTKYSVKYDAHLNECAAVARMSLGSSEEITVIEPGKEQVLFVELGWKDSTSVNQITEDFRNCSCDAGVAATITFTAAAG